MIDKTLEFIKANHLNIYDIAVMTDSGIEHTYCQPCNTCTRWNNQAFGVRAG